METAKLTKEQVKFLNEQAKEQSQKPVQSFSITIEWKKSRTWGANPHAYADVIYKDGTRGQTKTYKASGCGYCKESTVIADIFNELLKYRLYEFTANDKLPYGIRIWESELGTRRYYEGGVGASCYYSISEKIGGELKKLASGKSFDVYHFDSK
jgi:hypothetical protein